MSAVETYHRLTSFTSAKELYPDDPRLLGFEESVPGRMPAAVKEYPAGLPVVDLPEQLPRHEVPAADVLSGRRPDKPVPLDLAEVARLLYFSAGVLRYVRQAKLPRPHYMRAAGSAGNRHPLTLYVVAVGVAGLPDGVWHHNPLRHRLERVGDGPTSGPTYLVVTGLPYWDGWKYSERGYRHIWWDTGTMLSQVLALSGAAGLPAAVWLDFPDAEVSRLVGADGVQEFPCALVSLADGRPVLDVTGAPPVTGTVDPDPVEFPLITAAQRATDRTAWGGPARLRELPELAVPAGVTADPLEDVINRRVSTRGFTPGATVPADVVRWSLAAATRPFRGDAEPVPTTHHVFVLAVEGLEPGLYTWTPAADGGDPATGGDLRLVRAGDVTDDAYQLCVRQGLGSDGSYTVQHCATLDALLHGPDGERGYRIAQLSAGIVEGRLHLTAFAAGHGATGMTFVDGLLEPTLGVATEGLLTTCVGVPSYRSVPAGTPGHPREMARIRKTRLGDVD